MVVALAGLIGVLGAQLIAGRREDRRWTRELAREESRWQRERDREERNRRYQTRELAYVQFIGAVEALDWQLYPALRAARRNATLSNELRDRPPRQYERDVSGVRPGHHGRTTCYSRRAAEDHAAARPVGPRVTCGRTPVWGRAAREAGRALAERAGVLQANS
ncbi:MAG: hypothetical protein DLM55_05635 [Acidimicrobiales bacterium]|nr:MAG: hypothetical protein DLM55_05635 [Acidimicrobiales bacterium]